MSFDYFKEAQEIIKMLDASHLKRHAEAIQSAMDNGSTGTEIFMALRWSLDELLSDLSVDDPIFLKAKRLRREINNALK